MKKNMKIVLIAIIAIGIMVSCKKNESKDYTKTIRDKTWSGMLTNNGQPSEYYSVHFNADNSLKWNQLAGEYDGKWTLSGNQLTIGFTSLPVEIKADISNDHKLTNITDNNINSVINSGELVENPNIPLDNTSWSGTIMQSGVSKPVQLLFFTGAQIGLIVDNKLPPMTGAYARSASGGSFRVGIPTAFFGVLTSTGEMKGTCIVSPFFSWTVKKN